MIRLVVIDDQEALREGLVVLLEQAGIDVVATAGSAPAAIDMVAHGTPDVALISADLHNSSATDLARELIAGLPGLAVILYSSDVGTAAVREATEAGARGYVLKRCSLGELTDAIGRVADGGAYVDPRLDHKVETERLSPAPQLSRREREVLTLLAQGLTAESVGSRIGVSTETVRTHTRNAIRKTGARNRVHAIALALKRGEVELADS